MTRNEINTYRRILETNVIELNRSTRQRDAIVIEKSAEELESRLRANERELAIRNLETESVKLRETRAALQRIQDGSYGICEDCGDAINPRRLAALPSAARCIRCQEAMDCQCGAKHVRFAFAMAA